MSKQQFAKFGNEDFYTSSGFISEGNYACEFQLKLHTAEKKDGTKAGDERLGVMITFHNLDDKTAEPKQQFYSMGGGANKSFMPDETGKKLVPIPNAVAATLNNQTNWFYFWKSLRDSGMPKGIFEDDLSVLDGIHVHVKSIPEPAERKALGTASTGDAAQAPRKDNNIIIVSEIKDDGKPWEGGGGIPERAAAPKVNGKAGAAKTAPAKGKAPAKPTPPTSEADAESVASDALSSVLGDNLDGISTITLKTKTYKLVKEQHGDDMANEVQEMLKDNDTLKAFMETMGFVIQGVKVMPAPDNA